MHIQRQCCLLLSINGLGFCAKPVCKLIRQTRGWDRAKTRKPDWSEIDLSRFAVCYQSGPGWYLINRVK